MNIYEVTIRLTRMRHDEYSMKRIEAYWYRTGPQFTTFFDDKSNVQPVATIANTNIVSIELLPRPAPDNNHISGSPNDAEKFTTATYNAKHVPPVNDNIKSGKSLLRG